MRNMFYILVILVVAVVTSCKYFLVRHMRPLAYLAPVTHKVHRELVLVSHIHTPSKHQPMSLYL